MNNNIENIQNTQNTQNIETDHIMNIALLGIRHADHLWKRTFYGLSEQQIIDSLRDFFRQADDPEPLFYHVMSNAIVINHIYELATEFVSSLRADKMIIHIIDGWEDFFIRTNYTLIDINRDAEYGKLENCRMKIRQTLMFLLNHLGEEHCINHFYQKRIFELFFIRFDLN